jgi:hypothetical protein
MNTVSEGVLNRRGAGRKKVQLQSQSGVEMGYPLRKAVGTIPNERHNQMRILKTLPGAVFALLTLLLIMPATPANAQAYMHAVSNLRSARAYLQMDTRPAFHPHEESAISEINKAIDEMKKAAEHDGRDVWQAPPPQSGGDPAAPFHTALKLLRDARADIDHAVDQPGNQGLQARAIKHIDQAIWNLEQYINK